MRVDMIMKGLEVGGRDGTEDGEEYVRE